jgi:nucleotide-binding universal stress UspA family protein
MFRRILVTTDGSPLATLALPYAADLARTCGSALTVLYVVTEPPTPLALTEGAAHLYDPLAERQRQREEGQRILDEACTLLGDPQARLVQLEGQGHQVAEMIADEVELDGAELVVMSTHGRSGLAHLFVGSVAEQVLKRVRVPVFLVNGQRAAASAKPSENSSAQASPQASPQANLQSSSQPGADPQQAAR